MPAHHKSTISGVRDPHGGPLPGDASFRLHFPDAMTFMAAMKKAADLEAKGLHRRAWRVRWNIDGPQPVVAVPLPEEEDDRPPTPLSLLLEAQAEIKKLIRQSKLSHKKLSVQIGVSQQSVSNWNAGGYISRESFDKLKKFVEGLKK